MKCAPSEDSDQLGRMPSLIRVFTVRMKNAWVLNYPLSTQRRLWSDWALARADLSLRWGHRSFCWFCHVMAQYVLECSVCTRFYSSLTEQCLKQFWLQVSHKYLWCVKQICVFEHSVMTNFNCPCPAIQRDQGSGFLSEGASWLTACHAWMRRLAWTSAARIGDKYQIRLTRPIYTCHWLPLDKPVWTNWLHTPMNANWSCDVVISNVTDKQTSWLVNVTFDWH